MIFSYYEFICYMNLCMNSGVPRFQMATLSLRRAKSESRNASRRCPALAALCDQFGCKFWLRSIQTYARHRFQAFAFAAAARAPPLDPCRRRRSLDGLHLGPMTCRPSRREGRESHLLHPRHSLHLHSPRSARAPPPAYPASTPGSTRPLTRCTSSPRTLPKPRIQPPVAASRETPARLRPLKRNNCNSRNKRLIALLRDSGPPPHADRPTTPQPHPAQPIAPARPESAESRRSTLAPTGPNHAHQNPPGHADAPARSVSGP